MTDATRTTTRRCGNCPSGSYEIPIPAGLSTGEMLEALEAAEEAHARTHDGDPSHIRRQVARKWGDTFYAVKYGPDENGSKTLCGAPATDRDMAWGETRHASALAYVTCEDCKSRRAAREGAR